MSSDPLVVGLDCSTHGSKAIAWSLSGECVAEGRSSYDLLTPRPGWYEQAPNDWLSSAVEALRQVSERVGSRIEAIGLTAQRETFAGIDKDGVPVRPGIVWMDERAFQQVHVLRATIGEEIFHKITGKPVSITPSVTKLLWLRDREPECFKRAVRWLDVQGYVGLGLTGQDVTSVGSAESMGLIDLAESTWSDEVLSHVGLVREQLPSLVAPGTVVGGLVEEIAGMTGLRMGTPVILTAGDGQVAALGAQVLDLTRAYLNLGTAIVSGTVASEYLINRAFRTMSGAVQGTYLLESDLKGGTFTIDWLFRRFLKGETTLASLEQEAALLPPGADGLVLVPYLASVMNPYWDDDASGILVGLRPQHGPEHVYRAILEGIAMEQRLHLEQIELASGAAIEELRVLGGGASSELWCQMLADVLKRCVVRTRSGEATSLGAAMLAAVGVGLVESPAEASTRMGGVGQSFCPSEDSDIYDKLYERVYVKLYPALRPLLGRLADFTRELQSEALSSMSRQKLLLRLPPTTAEQLGACK